jgi:hypothetical protein
MSMPIGIEAAIPYLSAREMAELQKVLREREKRRPQLVKLGTRKPKLRLSSRKSVRQRAAVV